MLNTRSLFVLILVLLVMPSAKAQVESVVIPGTKAQAEAVYDSWELSAALPTQKELLGFDHFVSSLFPITGPQAAIQAGADFSALRVENPIAISVNIGLCTSADLAPDWMFRWNGFSPLSPPPESNLYRDVKIGQRLWVDKSLSVIRVQDGRIVMNINITTPARMIKTAAGKEFRRDEPTNDDILYAFNIARSILDRLTVMGLTSKPKEQVSKQVQAEVASRLEIARKQRAEWEAKKAENSTKSNQ